MNVTGLRDYIAATIKGILDELRPHERASVEQDLQILKEGTFSQLAIVEVLIRQARQLFETGSPEARDKSKAELEVIEKEYVDGVKDNFDKFFANILKGLEVVRNK